MAYFDKAKIQELIAKNDAAVSRGLLAIYARQTAAEQAADTTVEHNGVGFTGADGEILTAFAKWYQAKGFLTPRQMAMTRNKLKKYWKQLLEVAKANGHEVAFK